MPSEKPQPFQAHQVELSAEETRAAFSFARLYAVSLGAAIRAALVVVLARRMMLDDVSVNGIGLSEFSTSTTDCGRSFGAVAADIAHRTANIAGPAAAEGDEASGSARMEFTVPDMASANQKGWVWLEWHCTDGRLVCVLTSSTVVSDDVLDYIAALFGDILRAAILNPAIDVSDALGAGVDAYHPRPWEFGGDSVDPDQTLPDILAPSFTLHAERIAVDDGQQKLTYAELDGRSAAFAGRLQDAGIGRGSIVGVYCDRSTEMVIALLAIVRVGAAYLPLQPELPPDRIAYMLSDAKVDAIAYLSGYRAALPDQTVPAFAIDDHSDVLRGFDKPQIVSSDPVYVIYTSGSTGRPKGVVNVHGALCNRVLWIQQIIPLGPDDVVLQKTPFGFDVSVWEFFWPLLAGARIMLAKPEGHKDPAYLARLIDEKGVSLCHFVPSMLQVFLEEREVEARCGRLRHVLCSGEALSGALRDRFFMRMPGARLHNLYGPTEAAIDVSHHECHVGDESASVPIGRPAANTWLAVVDNAGKFMPPGARGELVIGGVQLAERYINRPDLTTERFPTLHYSPLGRATRFYRTGDIACFNFCGDVIYFGRADNQVKIRGVRIELGEVETVLSQAPGVRECIVLFEPHPSPRLVAGVVGTDEGAIDIAAITRFLEKRLVPEMVPRALRRLQFIPLTINGKADRAAAQAMLVERPEGMAITGTIRPQQVGLAGIWSEVLGTNVSGDTTDFFAYGGDSLSAARLANRIRAQLGKEVSALDVLANPLFGDLFDKCQKALFVPAGQDDPPDVPDRARLTSSQERLFFVNQHRDGGEAYNVPIALHLKGQISPERISDALRQLVERHEMLRMRFGATDEAITQWPEPVGAGPMYHSVAGVRTFDEARHLAEELGRQRFDLTSEIPFRAFHISVSDSEVLLVLIIHHIAIDGLSERILIDELIDILQFGMPSAAAPAVRFAAFADQQRRLQDGKDFGQEAAYWKGQLAGAIPAAIPPFGGMPRAENDKVGQSYRFELTPEVGAGCLALAAKHRTTPYVVMLAAYCILLRRYTREGDLTIGTTSSSRATQALESTVGCFINTLPLRIQTPVSGALAEFLAAISKTVVDAIIHQDFPFEKIAALTETSGDEGGLLQCFFSEHDGYSTDISGSAFEAATVALDLGTTQFHLALLVAPFGDGPIRARFEYRRDCYPRQFIEVLARQMSVILTSMTVSETIEGMTLLDAADRVDLRPPTQGRFVPRADSCIHTNILTPPTPGAIAIDAGTVRWTYEDLERESRQIARALRLYGVTKGQVVAVEAVSTPWTIAAFLAVLRSGAAYLPFDPQLGMHLRTEMFSENNVRVVLCAGDDLSDSARVIVTKDALPADDGRAWIDADTTGSDIAYVMYTSGSTGQPNGAAVSHRNLFNSTCARAEQYPGRVGGYLLLSPLYFDSSVAGIYWTLLQGGTLFMPHVGRTIDLMKLSALPRIETVTHLLTVPTLYQLMLQSDLAVRFKGLNTVILAGEMLQQHVVTAHRTAFPQAALYNEYGPTEATVWVSCWRVGEDHGRIPIGRPISNTQLHVVDETLRLLPSGAIGEICVAGENVSLGYVGRPDVTAARFVTIALTDTTERVYRTGDIGRFRPDGALEYFGRVDNQIKLRGFRLEPEQVESVLDAVDGVTQSAVVLQGIGAQARLVAFIVLEGGAGELNANVLRDAVKSSLPDYFCPSAFAVLPEMPRTATGKVDRKRLSQVQIAAAEQRVSRPLNPHEHIVSRIWQDLLGVEQADPDRNFFDAGGHSLLLMRLQKELNALSPTPIEIVALFRHTTIATQASLLRPEGGEKPALSRPDRRNARVSTMRRRSHERE